MGRVRGDKKGEMENKRFEEQKKLNHYLHKTNHRARMMN